MHSNWLHQCQHWWQSIQNDLVIFLFHDNKSHQHQTKINYSFATKQAVISQILTVDMSHCTYYIYIIWQLGVLIFFCNIQPYFLWNSCMLHTTIVAKRCQMIRSFAGVNMASTFTLYIFLNFLFSANNSWNTLRISNFKVSVDRATLITYHPGLNSKPPIGLL
jgi:hypothetical protein